MRRKREDRRSFGRRRGGEAVVVAAANGVGGDGATLGGREREPEKGGRRHGESARPGRVRGVADGVQGDEKKQEVSREVGGGPGLSGARHASVLLARRKTTGGVEMGWAVLGQVSGRQVTSFSLSLLFLFNSVFYFL